MIYLVDLSLLLGRRVVPVADVPKLKKGCEDPHEEWKNDVVQKKSKVWVTNPMLDVLFLSSKQVVNDVDDVALQCVDGN
jgi:hypothetical protein